jgi:hypothetical protein
MFISKISIAQSNISLPLEDNKKNRGKKEEVLMKLVHKVNV